MRVIGLDYGEKRIGLSYGDEVGIAVPLPAATASTPSMRMDQIARVIEQRRPDRLVVGYPYNMDGSVGFKAREVDAFIAQLEGRFRLPVHRVDETLTSHQVESDLKAAGRSLKESRKRRASGDVDSRAATLFLQDYLDSVTPAPPEC